MDATRIVIAGAAKPGYGQAITRRLLKEGFTVLGTYEPEHSDHAEQLRTEFAPTDRLHLSLVDHSSRDSLRAFVQSVEGTIHGLVYGQFFFHMEDPDNFEHDLWDRSIAVNLTAPNFLIHELKGSMADGSAIVIITSSEGFSGSFGASAYAATKAAIHNLVKSLANNLGARNIRVNALAPGWIGGVMDTDDVFNMSRRITPLGRLGSPEEVAAVAHFLLSSESGFVNGTTIVADGGYGGVDAIAKYEFEQSRSGE